MSTAFEILESSGELGCIIQFPGCHADVQRFYNVTLWQIVTQIEFWQDVRECADVGGMAEIKRGAERQIESLHQLRRLIDGAMLLVAEPMGTA